MLTAACLVSAVICGLGAFHAWNKNDLVVLIKFVVYAALYLALPFCG